MFGFMKKKDSSATPEAKTKKSKGFYLELEEATGINSAPKTTTPAAPPAAKPETVASPEVVTPEISKVEANPESLVLIPEDPTSKDPTSKDSNPKTKILKSAAKKAPESSLTPEPVIVANVVPEPAILPAYLQPNNTPRRRPGANMTMFKNMAQQVRTPKN